MYIPACPLTPLGVALAYENAKKTLAECFGICESIVPCDATCPLNNIVPLLITPVMMPVIGRMTRDNSATYSTTVHSSRLFLTCIFLTVFFFYNRSTNNRVNIKFVR